MITEYYTPEQQDKIAEIIHKGGYVTFEDNELVHVWNDVMDLEQRELTLMMAGFTGLTNEELETNGTLYFPVPKKDILDMLIEALNNEEAGYGMDETTMFTVGYRDGDIQVFQHGFCDLKTVRPLTDRQSGRTRDKIISISLKVQQIAFLIMTDGYEEPVYFATRQGLPALKKYGGFEEWHNGVGEKQRDYIQDDWV